MARTPDELEIVHDAVARFDRDFNAGPSGGRYALEELFHADAEIVPLRAALEGTTYTGPTAVREFIDASHERTGAEAALGAA